MMMSDGEAESGDPAYSLLQLPTTTYNDIYQSSDDDMTTTDDDVMGTYIDELPPDQVSKPLMHPRQRPTVRVKTQRIAAKTWHRLFWPLVYMFIFIASLAAFVCLIIYIVNVYTSELFEVDMGGGGLGGGRLRGGDVGGGGCEDIEVEDVWVVGHPKLLTESAFRLLDVNEDGVDDIIMGFATGVDKLRSSNLVCEIYFNGSSPCGGGMMALDGVTGSTLWTHWSTHEIFSLNCGADLDQDGMNDCIGGGRAGTFEAVSGRTGALLWRHNGTSLNVIMNAYTGQYMGDLDDDGVHDILNIHGGDPLGEPGSETRLGGKLVMFSGRSGEVLQVLDVPDGRESYYSPVLYQRKDGTDYVLYGTGGETHPGSLWIITVHDLLKGDINQSVALYTDHYKGIMTPPVLIDITKDGTEDIVFATFNSTVLAIDGETFKMLWNFTHPSAETYATPAPGYYNDDDIPDFLIRLQVGPGFPIYYHSITTILDGATGLPLLTPYLKDSVGAQTSPLTLSLQGQGNDLFLYWIADCHGAEGLGGQFKFIKEERYHTERSAWVNASILAEDFLQNHPAHRLAYLKWQEWIAENQERWRQKDREREEKRGRVEAAAADRDALEEYYKHKLYDNDDMVDSRKPSLFLPDREDYREDTEYRQNPEGALEEEEQREEDQILKHQIETIVKDILEEKKDNVWKSLYGSEPDDEEETYPSYGRGRDMGEPQRPVYQTLSSEIEPGLYGRTREPLGDTRQGPQGGALSEALLNGGQKRVSYTDTRRPFNIERLHLDRDDGSFTDKELLGEEDRDKKMDGLGEREDAVGRRRGELGRKVNILQNRGESLGDPREEWGARGSALGDRRDGVDSRGGYLGRRGHVFRESLGKSESKVERESKTKEQQLHEKYMESFGRKKSRHKRHVGPHDEGGLQRLISTGTLAPPLLDESHPDYSRSMDVIFATYWFYPAKTKILLKEDEDCIEAMMKNEIQRLDPQSEYYGMDHDGYEHEVTEQCLEKSGHIPEQGTYESQSTYNPYDVHMGQMTVYRLRLKCVCGTSSKTTLHSQVTSGKETCGTFLPFSEQQWPAYMGVKADSRWIPRQRRQWRRNDEHGQR